MSTQTYMKITIYYSESYTTVCFKFNRQISSLLYIVPTEMQLFSLVPQNYSLSFWVPGDLLYMAGILTGQAIDVLWLDEGYSCQFLATPNTRSASAG